MIQIQWFQAFLLVLGCIASSVVVIASYRKSNREQAEQNREVWEEAVHALKAHNEALQIRLKDAEELQSTMTREIGQLQGSLITLERDKRMWLTSNQKLFDLVQTYRARLAMHGEETPEPNNGG